MAAVASAIEPDAVEMIGDAPDEIVVLVSIAISLRRLADAHELIISNQEHVL